VFTYRKNGTSNGLNDMYETANATIILVQLLDIRPVI